jgi:Cu+-exporting ATPase
MQNGHLGQEGGMERDVVCGMQVDPAKAAGTSELKGKTYYFCSKSCKAKFDADPAKYAK